MTYCLCIVGYLEMANDDDTNESPFKTTVEAARFLRLKKRTLDNMRWRGVGPKYRKHGGRICYHVEDLTAWSNAHESTHAAER